MPAKMKFVIPQEKLEKLYFKKKWSMFQIADFYGCTHGTVVERFKRYGLKSRGHLGITPPLLISKAQLIQWYEKDELSIRQIAQKIGRSKSGVERRVKKHDIKLRGNENRKHWKYSKRPFNGNFEDKAYMIGFRLGDLNVSCRKQVIVVRGSTTKPAQAKLFIELFHDYGGVSTAYAKRGTIEQYTFLDRSFEFLVPKKDCIPKWIEECPRCFLSFFAGYADAEGSYMFNHKGRIGFEIQSYDKEIILHSWNLFIRLRVHCPSPSISKPRGYIGSNGIKHNGDAWRMSVYSKQSLWILLCLIFPFSKHKDKLSNIQKINEEIVRRNSLSGKGIKHIDLCHPIIPDHFH